MAVAKAIGAEEPIRQSSVYQWEKDKAVPTGQVLLALPGVLEINGHWLLTGLGQRGAPGAAVDLEAERAAVRREVLAEMEKAVVVALRGVTMAVSGGIVIGGSAQATGGDSKPKGPTADAVVGAAKATSRALRKQAEESQGKGKGQKAG